MSEGEVQTAWRDKYAPTSLEEMALEPGVRRQFESFIKSGTFPDHLLLSGDPGIGKSTAAKVFLKVLGPQVLPLNASKDRGIDIIKGKVETFAKTYPIGAGWKVVFMDEADGLTPEAQGALRGMMDDYSPQTKFLFTANEPEKLIEPLRSRCTKIEMETPPTEERARVLNLVLEKEGHHVPVDDVQYFAAAFEDMRDLLREAERSIGQYGTLKLPAEVTAGWGDAWSGEVDGHQLLADITTQFAAYVKLPEGGLEAVALWTLYTHVHEAFGLSPILAVYSPTMESGKSTVFDIISFLCPGLRGRNILHVAHLTPASLHHLGGLLGADENPWEIPPVPTPPNAVLLADEVDAWMKVGDLTRAALDGGYSRTMAFKLMAKGLYSTWYPKAVGFIESDVFQLPTTIRSRSIGIPMKKVIAEQTGLKEFRMERPHPEMDELKQKAARWALDHYHQIIQLPEDQPPMPGDLRGRAKSSWRILFTIASLAGGPWSEIVEKAWRSLTKRVGETRENQVQLIIDIHTVFESDQSRPDRLPTAVLIEGLHGMEDQPWAEVKLGVHKLSRMLHPFGIGPKALWTTTGSGKKGTRQGYFRRDFEEFWKVYLPQPPTSGTSGTPALDK